MHEFSILLISLVKKKISFQTVAIRSLIDVCGFTSAERDEAKVDDGRLHWNGGQKLIAHIVQFVRMMNIDFKDVWKLFQKPPRSIVIIKIRFIVRVGFQSEVD